MAKLLNLGGIASMLTGLQNRAYSDRISGVDATSWPTAGQPVTPMAPPGSPSLIFPYTYGRNLDFTPRSDAVYTAADLQALSTYPLARICIDNTKDILCKTPWSIELRKLPGESDSDVAARRKAETKGDENIFKLSNMFEWPDGQHDWSEWLRPTLEDMLVMDGASTLIQRNRRGKVLGFEWTSGAPIAVYINDRGGKPKPPDPAYAQLWQGMPRTDLTSDQLVYKPRNIVTRMNVASSFLYGMSPTETVADEIKIGMGRLAFVMAYYDAGSMGNMIHVVPPGVPPDKVKEAMQWVNSEMAGNYANRRQYRIIQGFQEEGKQDQLVFPEEPVLADVFDDLIIRKLSFAFGTSPQRLLKQMNRGCHDEQTETLTENGWKRHWDIQPGERIATINPESGALEYQQPSRKILYDHSGDMYRFNTRGVDVLVTPDHRMWVSKYYGSRDEEKRGWLNYAKIPARMAAGQPMKFMAVPFTKYQQTTPSKPSFEIPQVAKNNRALTVDSIAEIRAQVKQGISVSKISKSLGIKAPTIHNLLSGRREDQTGIVDVLSMPMADWLEFLGYYISEGGMSHAKNHYLLTLSQNGDKNSNIASNIQTCLERSPLSWKRYPDQVDGMIRWNVYGKDLCTYLMDNVGGYCYDKRIPREFLDLPADQLAVLFSAMMDGDGHWEIKDDKSPYGTYTTTSKQLADDFQELAFKLGWCSFIRKDPPPTPKHNAKYIVNLCIRDEHSINSSDISLESYTGKVYCYTVPNGIFVTRRNSRIAIHGNSADAAQTSADDEGIQPWIDWVRRYANYIIQRVIGLTDYEMVFGETVSDYIKKAKAELEYVKEGVLARNEVRDGLGMDASANPFADKLCFSTVNGVVELGSVVVSGKSDKGGDGSGTGGPAPAPAPTPSKTKLVERGER